MGSDKFYKALVRRCRNLPIGQAADRLRRFPEDLSIEAEAKALITIHVKANGGDDRNDGSSWAKAKKSIQAAVDAASITGGSVWVAGGTYPEAIRLASGIDLIGGFRGDESRLDQRQLTNQTLSQIDASKAADGQPAVHAVMLDGITSTTLDGFWIKGGEARGLDEGSTGGGIFCRRAGPSNVLRNCIVSGCRASVQGGGVFMDRASPRMIGCTLVNNLSSDTGGGLCCIRESNPQLEHCVLANNGANFGLGGGLYAECSTPSLEACQVSGNWTGAMMGGGIYLCVASPTLTNCMITGNSAGTYGGGLAANGESTTTLQSCTVVDNKANQGGGGVFLGELARGAFTNCIFDHNQRDGIYTAEYHAPAPRIEHCLFNANSPAHFRDDTTKTLELARQLNELLPGAKGNLGGDPMFASKARARKGKWTSRPVYHPETGTTILVDRHADFRTLAGQVMLLRTNKKHRTVSFIVAVHSPTTAYSDQSGHRFRRMSATDSDRRRPPLPTQGDRGLPTPHEDLGRAD